MFTVASGPQVYLVGRQVIDNDRLNDFLMDIGEDPDYSYLSEINGGAEELAEVAGRVCYMSFGKKKGRKSNQEYLEHILESGHGSVIEHCVWNFIVTGVSRSLTHELIRHRVGFGYSMLSQRYVDESTAEFIEPDIIKEDAYCHGLWTQTVEASHRTYMALVEVLAEKIAKKHPKLSATERRKMARGAARSILPNATETKIFITANARALRHFIELRGSPAADGEIRRLAVALLKIMHGEAFSLFGDMKIDRLEDGTEGVTAEWHKV